MWVFANAIMKGFSLVKETLKSHRLTLLKHQQALDLLLAKTRGLCVTLNLTGGACMTLIPDTMDNLTDVISPLNHFKSALLPRSSHDDPSGDWLTSVFGSLGEGILQLLLPIIRTILFLIIMCLMTCTKAMLRTFIATSLTGVIMQTDVNATGICENMEENPFQQLQLFLEENGV